MNAKIPTKHIPCILAAVNVLLGGCLCGMVVMVLTLGLPLPLPQALPFGVLFDDDFASEMAARDNGWVFLDAANAQVRWSPGSLTQLVKTKNYNYSSCAGKQMRNLAVEVEAKPSSDPQTAVAVYGIVFGMDGKTNDSYRFGATTSGSYSLSKVHNSKIVQPSMVEFTFSPYLNPRPEKNRLGVIVEGSRISLYINGSLVNSVIDDSINSGQIGVFTDSLWSDRAEVSYSRVRVLSVERAKLEWGTRFAGEAPAQSNGVLFDDEFSSQQEATDNGWSFGEGTARDLRWTPDGYTIVVKDRNDRVSSVPSRQYKDFGIEVEAQSLDNSGAWYGVVFRARLKGGSASDEYRFTIYPTHGDLWYFLVKEVDGKSPVPWPVDPGPSRFIRSSGKNRLGVLAEGSTISLYINGERVKTITDQSLASGEVGVFVHNLKADRAEVAFSRMTIYTVEKAKAVWGAPPNRPGILFESDLRSKEQTQDEGWDYGPYEGVNLNWSAGKVTMEATTKGHFNGPFFSRFSDFAVEIEAQPNDKPFITYGVYFREQITGKVRSCYSFEITPSGRYYLLKLINGVVMKPYLVDIALSPYINKGKSKNRLGVIAEGETISLYINGNLIRTVKDNSLSYGTMGVFVGPSGSDEAKVDVTRFTVSSVEEAKKQWGDPSKVRALPDGVLLEDDFSSQPQSIANGWIFESDDSEEVSWAPNRLTIAIKKRYLDDGIPIWTVFDNFGMEIEAQAEDKPDSSYGIGFRIGDSGGGWGYYNFFINTQGMYSLLKRVNGKWADKDLVPLTQSPYIKRGSSKNRLGVLADGPNISLFINGNMVKSIVDDLVPRGYVGIEVSNGQSDRAEFYLSRVTVYTVEKAKIELARK